MTRDKKFYSDFFSLLVFIALQNLIVYCVNLADNIMLGRWSEEALSGVALANQIQFLLQMIVTSAGEGVVILASQYWGKKDPGTIPSINCTGLIIGLIIGSIFTLAGFFFPHQLLGLLSNEEPILAEGVKYMRIICWTYVIYCITTILLCTMRAVENVHIGMYTSVLALVVNIFLNYCLIFGRLGFPRLGVEGAAIATLVARLSELIFTAVFTFRIDKKLRMKVRQLFRGNRIITKDYYRVAVPIMLGGASWGIAQFIQTSILGHLGSSAVAANSIAASLFSIISVVAYGSGNASAVFIGKYIGGGDHSRLHEYVNTIQLMFLMIGIVSGTLLFSLKGLIISFYKVSADTAALANQFLTVLSITLVGTSYQAPALSGIVKGGGETSFVFYNDLIFQWGIVITTSLLAAFVWKLDPVWVFLFLKCDQILKCFVAVVKVNRYTWVRKLTRENIA